MTDTKPKDLRDEFAMAALNGLLADGDDCLSSIKDLAKKAYRYADAMMEARKK